jgi:2-heptyl-3-hydroxy-4(1H)-quinolone synthase
MICINGAGIAGLTLANCLEKLNIDYFIVEKAEKFRVVGAGLIIQQNGLAILEALDLLSGLKAANVEQLCFGPVHKSICLGEHDKFPIKAVHRGELQRLLLKNIDSDKIHLNQQIQSFKQTEKGVLITLKSGEVKTCSLLIEAAGIHANSHVDAELENTQHWCWRTIVPGKEKIRKGIEHWFGKNRIGVFPISDLSATENNYYVFQVLDTKEKMNPALEQQRLAWVETIKKEIPELANLDFSNANWLSHGLQQRAIHWGDKRVIAIGDAAHALTPNLGQGAVLAMEDAYCLANLIQSGVDANELLTLFIEKRHKRVETVKKQSLNAGKSAHLDNPVSVFLRNFMLALLPARMVEKQQARFMDAFIETMLPLTPSVEPASQLK